LKKLEENESEIVENLHKTISWEQQQTLRIKEEIGLTERRTESPNKKPKLGGLLEVYRVPKTTLQMIQSSRKDIRTSHEVIPEERTITPNKKTQGSQALS
jgi:hypothetical protein